MMGRNPPRSPEQADRAALRSRATGPWSLYFLKAPSIVVGCLGLVGTVLCWLILGSREGLGVLVGVVIVIAFFTISAWTVALLGEANPKLALPAAIGGLLLLCLLLGVVMLTLPRDGAVHTTVMALTVAIGTVAWIMCQVTVVLRTPLLYADPAADPAPAPDGKQGLR